MINVISFNLLVFALMIKQVTFIMVRSIGGANQMELEESSLSMAQYMKDSSKTGS